MARGRKVQDDDDAGGGPPSDHNQGDMGARIAEVVEAIEAELAKIDKLTAEHKLRCTPMRDAIKRIKKAANEADIHATPLNALLRQRRLLKQAEEVTKHMDEEQAEEFAAYSEAHRDFLANTPLGQAAAQTSAKGRPNLRPVPTGAA